MCVCVCVCPACLLVRLPLALSLPLCLPVCVCVCVCVCVSRQALHLISSSWMDGFPAWLLDEFYPVSCLHLLNAVTTTSMAPHMSPPRVTWLPLPLTVTSVGFLRYHGAVMFFVFTLISIRVGRADCRRPPATWRNSAWYHGSTGERHIENARTT